MRVSSAVLSKERFLLVWEVDNVVVSGLTTRRRGACQVHIGNTSWRSRHVVEWILGMSSERHGRRRSIAGEGRWEMCMLSQRIGFAFKRTSSNIGMLSEDRLNALLGQLFRGVNI